MVQVIMATETVTNRTYIKSFYTHVHVVDNKQIIYNLNTLVQ